MNIFYGRHKELLELENRFLSKKKEFGVIYGRRRIGKSQLLIHFAKNKNSIIFQAKRDSAYGNLRSFCLLINPLLSLPKDFVFASWEEALSAVNKLAEKKRLVLVIDEYPYIVNQYPAFASVLQNFIDHACENMLLIISGSDVSFLVNEIKNHASPLYKRRTFEIELRQLTFSEAVEFFPRCANETKAQYLSLMSTYPYYLSSLDFSKEFDENLIQLLFNQYGSFFELPDHLLSNATQVQDVYNSILMAITNHKTSNKDIASYIKETEPKTSKYILTLLQSEIVTKCETYMGNRKSNYYEISDPLLKFWYKFIFPNQERIKIDGRRVFNELKEQIHQFISFGFEEVCRLYMDQLNRNGELPGVFPKAKTYRVENSRLGRSIEIDGLTNNKDCLIVIDCKYRKNKFDTAMLDHLKESASVFSNRFTRYYYIFSKSGFTAEVVKQKSLNLKLFSLNDLF